MWTLAELTELDLRLRNPPAAPPHVPHKNFTDRPTVLRDWLRSVRDQDPEAARLSEAAVQSEVWLRLAFTVFSLLSGAAAAAALLRYEGDRLINVSAYLGVLVGGQLALLTGFALISAFSRRRLSRLHAAFFPPVLRSFPADNALPAWRYRIFSTFQQAGAAFNVGALLATLGKVLAFDLAFGWATTLAGNGQGMHRIVQLLSLPWGGHFAPSPEQIRQSRIVLKEGLRQVDTAAAAAWWPFLCLCLLVYGLLPRLLLWIYGQFRLFQCLRRPALASAAAERLYHELTRPPLRFTPRDPAEEGLPPFAKSRLRPLRPAGALRLEISAEILPPARHSAFAGALRRHLQVECVSGEAPAAGVLRVLEVWQPPLRESLRQLRALREAWGADADLLLLAVGRPDSNPDRFFSAPASEDLRIWEEHLGELKDPRLGLLIWPEGAA